MGFGKDTEAWGIFDAIRAVRIEDHVVDAIASLLKDTGAEDEVDMVEEPRTILFFTKEEEANARDEYEAAKAAGIDVSVAEWLSEGEVEKVQYVNRFLPHDNNRFVDIRSTISGGAHSREHSVASQARHPLVQTCAGSLTSSILEVAHTHARDGNQPKSTLRRWRYAPVATTDASWLSGMYARRTCDKRIRIRTPPTTFRRAAHWSHCAHARTSHVDPRGRTHTGAHTVWLHGQLRDGVLVRASRLGPGRAPASHPRRCAPR